jgi:hypothetical protein
MQIKTIQTHTIVLTDEEMKMLEAAIGSTSISSRTDAGMSLEHSKFISELYGIIVETIDFSR